MLANTRHLEDINRVNTIKAIPIYDGGIDKDTFLIVIL